MAGCMSQVVEAGGARALYRGLGASVLGVIPYSGIKLSTYDRLKRGYQTWAESERVQPLATLVRYEIHTSYVPTSLPHSFSCPPCTLGDGCCGRGHSCHGLFPSGGGAEESNVRVLRN